MTDYQSPEELIDFLYTSFTGILTGRGIDAYTGSGSLVPLLLRDRIFAEINAGKIPAQYSLLTAVQDNDGNVYRLEDSIILLANQMADDALAENKRELHEWSLANVKHRLCPLYPFFREPCDQYDPLIGA